MSSFEAGVAREYFERHGFSVRQIRPPSKPSRKQPDEEAAELWLAPVRKTEAAPVAGFFLFASDLPKLGHAVVLMRAWHNHHRFPPNKTTGSAGILKFVESCVLKQPPEFFEPTPEPEGWPPVAKVLVLPSVPTVEKHRKGCEEALRGMGVDHVLSFRTMLLDLVDRTDTNTDYRFSPHMQTLRLLKIYDLVKQQQLELFPPEG